MAAAPGVRRSELGEALRACRNAFIGVGVMSCMINLLYLTGSVFMLEIYDRVLPSRSVPTLVGLVMLAAVLYIAQGVLDLLRGRILGRIGTSLDEAINARVFETVVRLPLLVGGRNEGLQPLRDLDNVRSFLGSMGPGAFFDLPWLPLLYGDLLRLPLAARRHRAGRRRHPGHADADYRIHVARAGQGGHGACGAAQRPCRYEPPQRRSADRDGHVRAAEQALGRGQRGVSCRQPARQRRHRRARRGRKSAAHDAAILGARGRRLSGDPSGSNRRHHHRWLDPERAGAGAGRSGDCALEGFCRGAPELASPHAVAAANPGCEHPDPAAGPFEAAFGRSGDHGRARRPAGDRAGRYVRARDRQRRRHHRAERFRQVVAGPRAGRRLDAGPRQGAARRRRARPVVLGRARPPCRLPAAGCRIVRGLGGAKHLPLRSRGQVGGHHRRRQGSRCA